LGTVQPGVRLGAFRASVGMAASKAVRSQRAARWGGRGPWWGHSRRRGEPAGVCARDRGGHQPATWPGAGRRAGHAAKRGTAKQRPGRLAI